MMLSEAFWVAVARGWGHMLTAGQRERIEHEVRQSVGNSLQTLEELGTFAKIPSALDAILADDDNDDDDEDW